MRRLLPAGVVLVFAAAFAFGGDANAPARELAALTRPASLPFLWRALGDATRTGDAREAFERSKDLLAATPGWTDGHAVFAFRFALDGDDLVRPEAERIDAAKDRLDLALRFLDEAALGAGPRAAALFADAAWLVELAVRQEPRLAERLGTDVAVVVDEYLARAERLGAGRMVREQRLYDTPRLCAAFLRAGDRERALTLLQDVAARCERESVPALRDDWRTVLQDVQTALWPAAPGLDEAWRTLRIRLAADPRLQPLAPFLR